MLSAPVVGIANWRLTRCPGMCRSAPGHRKGRGSALPCDQSERIREPAMRHVVWCGEWPLGTRWADSQVRGSHRPRRSLLLRSLRPGGGLPGPEWGRQDDHGARRLRTDRAGLRDCQVERGPCRPERAPPLQVHAGGTRSVSGHAHRRAARVPRQIARDERARRNGSDKNMAGAARRRRQSGQQGGCPPPWEPAAGATCRRVGART